MYIHAANSVVSKFSGKEEDFILLIESSLFRLETFCLAYSTGIYMHMRATIKYCDIIIPTHAATGRRGLLCIEDRSYILFKKKKKKKFIALEDKK